MFNLSPFLLYFFPAFHSSDDNNANVYTIVIDLFFLSCDSFKTNIFRLQTYFIVYGVYEVESISFLHESLSTVRSDLLYVTLYQ